RRREAAQPLRRAGRHQRRRGRDHVTGPTPDELLAALEKLPAASGVTYRGLSADAAAPASTFVTHEFTATSRDPRVATENFTASAVVAIAGRTGRDIAFLAHNPAEAEVVFLPGTILRPVSSVLVVYLTVHITEELLTPDARPPLRTEPITPVRSATAAMTIASPG